MQLPTLLQLLVQLCNVRQKTLGDAECEGCFIAFWCLVHAEGPGIKRQREAKQVTTGDLSFEAVWFICCECHRDLDALSRDFS